MIKKLKNNKAFTLIELLVVIVVLAMLVLLAAPKLLGYIDEAELARIQHDTKVMENKMAEILNQPEDNYNKWVNNGKDLGTLVLKNQLFEKQGLATAVNMKHLTHGNKVVSLSNPYENIGIGGNLYGISEQLGRGGENYELGPSSGYKIIPESFKKTIGTHLDGTFYVNKLGKVYYEPNKPISSIKKDQPLACVAAETLDYEFDNSTGTIIKYNGTLQYITIPSAFEVDGKCVPVKIIGSGAFMRGDFNFKKITIPQSVKEIQENAFKGNELTEIEIPHSVDTIGPGAFSDNKIESVVIKKSSNDINIGSGAFSGNGSNGISNASPIYKVPTASDLKIVFNKSTGTIVSGYGVTSGGSYGGSSGGDSGGSTGSGSGGSAGSSGGESSNKDSIAKQYDNTNRVISIPKTILVDGEEHVIKEISKGAFQGQGIIYVEFPDSLERIEDYAFAGNQLIGVKIPNQIGYIGNYAFAFNEVNEKQTISHVEILGTSQKEKINDWGDIAENGLKVDILANKVNLLDHIFIISTAKFEIPMEYNPITKFVNSEIPGLPKVNGLTENSATVDGGKGTEVSLGDGKWHDSPYTFTGLNEGSAYKAYSRYKETDSHYASKVSGVFDFKTSTGALYELASAATFTNAGATGSTGPTQSQVNYAYRGTEFEGHVTSQGGIQLWTVPKTGTYRIEARGARGGSSNNGSIKGGNGAIIAGDFNLEKGEKISILVGQFGGDTSNGQTGGGGGTFVYKDPHSVNPLIAAGGGGGSLSPNTGYSRNTGVGINASASASVFSNIGGSNSGRVNVAGEGAGWGGAGWRSNSSASTVPAGQAPYAYAPRNGGAGHDVGGFGGGHATNWTSNAGAGGGYTGGIGAYNVNGARGSGGGSYNSGANQSNLVGNYGHGQVKVTYLGE